MHYVTSSRVRDLNRILSERDQAIVATVAQLRFATGSQLQRIHIAGGTPLGNARVARRVLQRLVTLEVLDRLDRRVGGAGPRGSDGYIYVLAIGGQYLVHKRQLLSQARRRRLSVPGQLFVQHALTVAELHVRLIEAERARQLVLVQRLGEPDCWYRFPVASGRELTLKPDAYAHLRMHAHDERYLLDVDRGTEGSRTLESRLRIYARYYRHRETLQSFHDAPKALWLARNSKRVNVIREMFGSLPTDLLPLFTAVHFDDAIDTVTSPMSSKKPLDL
jgi:Replication-relaxation